jgi:hypothetical protein
MPGSRLIDRIQVAAKHVVAYYCPPEARRVVILFHAGHERIACAVASDFARRGVQVTPIQTDNGDTPWKDLRAEITRAVADADLVLNFYFLRYKNQEWRGERISFLRELIHGNSALVSGERYRLFKDLDEHAFARIFGVDPRLIDRLNLALLNILSGRSRWYITSPHGTELEVIIDTSTWPVINCNGFGLDDYEMPPGELMTHPKSVDGSLVLSGAMIGTVPIGRKYGCLRDPMLRLDLEDGVVTSVQSALRQLEDDVAFCIALHSALSHVGEVAVGTHIGLGRLDGLNYEYEERYPGFHLGLGVSQADEAIGNERRTEHHLDFVLLNSTIYFGEVCVMRDGQFSDLVWQMAENP